MLISKNTVYCFHRSYALLSTWHGAVPGWWVSRIDQHTHPLPSTLLVWLSSSIKAGFQPVVCNPCRVSDADQKTKMRNARTRKCGKRNSHRDRPRADFMLVCVAFSAFFMCVRCVRQVGNRPWTSVSVDSIMLTSAHRTLALDLNWSYSSKGYGAWRWLSEFLDTTVGLAVRISCWYSQGCKWSLVWHMISSDHHRLSNGRRFL